MKLNLSLKLTKIVDLQKQIIKFQLNILLILYYNITYYSRERCRTKKIDEKKERKKSGDIVYIEYNFYILVKMPWNNRAM